MNLNYDHKLYSLHYSFIEKSFVWKGPCTWRWLPSLPLQLKGGGDGYVLHHHHNHRICCHDGWSLPTHNIQQLTPSSLPSFPFCLVNSRLMLLCCSFSCSQWESFPSTAQISTFSLFGQMCLLYLSHVGQKHLTKALDVKCKCKRLSMHFVKSVITSMAF